MIYLSKILQGALKSLTTCYLGHLIENTIQHKTCYSPSSGAETLSIWVSLKIGNPKILIIFIEYLPYIYIMYNSICNIYIEQYIYIYIQLYIYMYITIDMHLHLYKTVYIYNYIYHSLYLKNMKNCIYI